MRGSRPRDRRCSRAQALVEAPAGLAFEPGPPTACKGGPPGLTEFNAGANAVTVSGRSTVPGTALAPMTAHPRCARGAHGSDRRSATFASGDTHSVDLGVADIGDGTVSSAPDADRVTLDSVSSVPGSSTPALPGAGLALPALQARRRRG